MEPGDRLKYLFHRYIEESSSELEKEELFSLIAQGKHDDLLAQLVDEKWEGNIPPWERENDEERAEMVMHAVKQQLKERPFFTWQKIAIAASFLLLLGAGSYLLVRDQHTPPVQIANLKAPQQNKAMITLSNGQQLLLANIDQVNLGNATLIRNANGTIDYKKVSMHDGQVTYNILTNPKGSQVTQITLSDGTKVWLNVGSSLTYPIAFPDKERKVSISGEAYFEVAKDASRPFRVSKGDITINVLGTAFNINAYEDEALIAVTLVQGSVQVSRTRTGSYILKPGEQAQIGDGVTIAGNVNTRQVMAWKNGMFQFGEKTDLQNIMRQIARWYDIEVTFEGTTTQQNFGGEIPRNSDLQQVLEILKTSGVHFNLIGRKIIVQP